MKIKRSGIPRYPIKAAGYKPAVAATSKPKIHLAGRAAGATARDHRGKGANK